MDEEADSSHVEKDSGTEKTDLDNVIVMYHVYINKYSQNITFISFSYVQ